MAKSSSNNKSNRGFAAMDENKQKEIASKGGKASSGGSGNSGSNSNRGSSQGGSNS